MIGLILAILSGISYVIAYDSLSARAWLLITLAAIVIGAIESFTPMGSLSDRISNVIWGWIQQIIVWVIVVMIGALVSIQMGVKP